MTRLGDLFQRSAFRSGADRTLELASPSAESGSAAQVYEVTDLLVPAGTDWSGSEFYALLPDTARDNPSAGLVQAVYLEIAEPLASGDALFIQGPLDTFALGDEAIDPADVSVADTTTGTRTTGQTLLFAAITTNRATTADITIVRARVAFLAI